MRRYRIATTLDRKDPREAIVINCDSYRVNKETGMYEFIGSEGDILFSLKFSEVIAIEPRKIPEVTEGIQRNNMW